MLFRRQNIAQASEDQEGFNLYNNYLKNINLKQDVEKG